MSIPLSLFRWVLFALVAAWLLWLAALWQPARQVELHTNNLLKRASARDWPAVEAIMAVDYRDAWNADRAAAIDEARKLFSHFFALQITPLESLRITEADGGWEAAGPVGVFGSGTAVAHAVMDKVREAEGEFTFRWRKSGTWPWQWALVGSGHPELDRYGRRDGL